MASVNKVILVGNLGADPEIRFTPNGTQVATVSLATTSRWKDKVSGETKENTEWHRVVFYKRLAEIVGDCLKKGSQIYVEGELRTRKWTDDKKIDRYSTEVIGGELQMLGKKDAGSTPTLDEPPVHDNFHDED
ncbi:MAG: single-stranded DNA-binding protein [Methyloglobulus sp.]|jgi:single-strand DNA-binding protein|nr:single-stranded DNA-binding protein [Methyloglobulus sp.]